MTYTQSLNARARSTQQSAMSIIAKNVVVIKATQNFLRSFDKSLIHFDELACPFSGSSIPVHTLLKSIISVF